MDSIEQELQQGKVEFVSELGKDCIVFICDHCGKTIYKPKLYVRDPNSLIIGIRDVEINCLHECEGLVHSTRVMFKRNCYEETN